MIQRIACTAITGRIVMGRVGKDGRSFVGEKRDVTSDVLKAVIDKGAFHGGSFDVEGGGEKWLVTVTHAAATETTAAEPCDMQDPWCMSCARPRSAVCSGGGAWAWGDQAEPWGLCSDCVVAARTLLATSRRLEARGFFSKLDSTDPQTARDAKEMRDALALAAPLEAPEQVDTTSREQYKRMFHSACIALGEVGEALGLHPGAASPVEMLTAIHRLKANQKKRRGQTAPAEGGAAC